LMFTNIRSISAPSPRCSRTSARSPRRPLDVYEHPLDLRFHPLGAGEQRPDPAFLCIEPRRTPSGRTFGSLPKSGTRRPRHCTHEDFPWPETRTNIPPAPASAQERPESSAQRRSPSRAMLALAEPLLPLSQRETGCWAT
jgi:hypothetical protein